MFQRLEILFLAGLATLVLAVLWLVWVVVRRQRQRIWLPLLCGAVGLMAVVGPAVYTRFWQEIDLGPRERMVDGERHLTLTGWDGKSYDFLAQKTDTVLLQMANPDVDDDVLQTLSKFSKLRELDLNDTRVTDNGLRHLSSLATLQILRLRGTQISEEGFREYLLPLGELKNLDLRQTAIGADLLNEWKAAKPGRRALK